MLPILPIQLAQYAREEAVRNQMRARSRDRSSASDERLRALRGVIQRLEQSGPLPGWPEPRSQPDPIPADGPGPIGGQGGPDQSLTPQQAAAAELARRRAESGRTGAEQPTNAAPAEQMTPQEAAAAELARRRSSKPQTDVPLGLDAPPAFPAYDARGRMDAMLAGKAYPVEPSRDQNGHPITDWRKLPILENAEPMRPDAAKAFAAKAAHSATFGQADKAVGLATMLATMDPKKYGEGREAARDWLRLAEEYEPGASFAGEMTGFLAPGGLLAKPAQMAFKPLIAAAQRANPVLGFLAKTGSAAAQGLSGGAAYGATVGAENEAIREGRESPELLSPERAEAAKTFGATGAAFGAALPAVGVALRPVSRFVGGLGAQVGDWFIPGTLQKFNRGVANDAARRSLERAGILNVEDFLKRASKYGDKPVVTGELGQDPLNSLVSLVRSKGTTADKAMAVLEDRVAGLPGRMFRDIAEETGLKPDEVFGQIEDMVKAGRARAAPLYEASEAAPFAETPNLERILRAPVIQGLLSKARGRVGNQAVDQIGSEFSPSIGKLGPESTVYGAGAPRRVEHVLGPTMSGGNSAMPPIKVYDELKQLLDEEINRRIAVGEGIDDVTAIRSALVRELDQISAEGADYLANTAGNKTQITAPNASPYARAREAGGDAPRIEAGLKAGERALSGARLAQDVEREVAQLSGGQLTAYQIGVIRNLVKEVENGRLTPRRIKTEGFAKKLRSTFGDPAANGLLRRFGIEAELITKGSRWNPNVGSVTSQAQMGRPSQIGDEMVRAAANAMTGNKVGLMVQLANALRRGGYSEGQLNELGDIFLSSPEAAARRLFPGQTPAPGSIPPPIPPVGRIRDNPPGGSRIPTQAGAPSPAMAPLMRDALGGSAGAAFGAVTTPEGEDPAKRALGYGLAGAALTHGIGSWRGAPTGQTQLNAFPLAISKTLPWVKAMEKAKFSPREIEITQRILQARFTGQNIDQIAERIGLPPDSLKAKIGDLQRRLKTAGIDVDINRAQVGESMVAPPRAPVIPRQQLPPKDLITAYNDGDSALNIGLDLDLPENANIANRIATEQTRLRNVARDAMQRGNVGELAKQWNVTPDEIQAFVAKRPRGGGFEQSIARIVETAEKAAKAGQPIRPHVIAQRLGMTPGSVNSMLSQARSGARKVSDDLKARLDAIEFARGKPSTVETPPELGGALLGGITGGAAPADNPTDRLRNAGLGALLGAGAGRLQRATGNKAPGARQGSMIPTGNPKLSEVLPDDLIEDATQESLRAIQQRYISAGQAPPVFKTFRLPDGRVVAWRSDGDFRGGMSHDQARDVLGLGNARLEHGQFKYGDDLGKTNWYGTSGKGEAPRSIDRMARQAMAEGKQPGSALMDAYPEEIIRDLRAIGAIGPDKGIGNYSYRRSLATKGVTDEGHSVTWQLADGREGRVAFAPGGRPGMEIVQFRIDNKTTNDIANPRGVSTSEVKAFGKAMAVLEREAIKRGQDVYLFDQASPQHGAFYLRALQEHGAPQGYVGIVDPAGGNFALVRKAHFDAEAAAGRIDTGRVMVVPSKRGNKEVPEWRRLTGQFALPVGAAGSLAAVAGSQRTDEPRAY